MHSNPRIQGIVQKLKQAGCRITPQRLAILEVVTESRDHLTAEQIHAQVTARFPTTSLATVYKTVNLLRDEGELIELGFSGSAGTRYDGARPNPHPHLICVRCERILDPEIRLFDELPRELTETYGFRLLNHRIDIYGICPECQAREKTSP